MKVEEKVLEVLEKYPEARENYAWLVVRVWQIENPRIFVPYREVRNLTSPETIVRIARKIQNDLGLYTAPHIRAKRRSAEQDWRRMMRREACDRATASGGW